MGLVIPQHRGGIRTALDRAADRAIDQALRRPGDWIAGALLSAIVLLAVAWGLREDEDTA